MSLLTDWGERLDGIAPVAKRVGDKADEYACTIIGQLREINEGVRNLYSGADAYAYPRLVLGAGSAGGKVVEGRQGYSRVIENVAIIAPAAANVDLYVMSADSNGFVKRFVLAAAGRDSATVQIPVPEGQPIFVESSLADVNVNLIVRRVKP